FGELTLHVVASRVACRKARERTACVALGGAPNLERAFELAARRVRDDRPRRIRLDAPAVEMVDAPTLVAVLECVLLAPAVPHDLDEPLSGQLRCREEADLPSLLGAHDDAADPTAPAAEIAQPAPVPADLLATD